MYWNEFDKYAMLIVFLTGPTFTLGDGDTADRNEPTLVKGSNLFTAVKCGGYHSCAAKQGITLLLHLLLLPLVLSPFN